ncbi:hypothetical protein TSUD_98930 [Trifolium subterraneum]|uniref:RNase H type-1 domain-containing protein n=1 Tax=Trifolium subterraneum TaxID=3900 RepID=A0A2Z6NUC2_TRISU|nr:hypothetical protein TSUD_98930 [Trifolium subterraneum]
MHICPYEDKNTAGKVAMLAWVLWNNRNNCVWNNEREPRQQLGVKALHFWNEWNAVNIMREPHRQSAEQQQQQQQMPWTLPPDGWQKCNVDAGFHDDVGKKSVGWCIRDSSSQFVLAGTFWLHGRFSIIEGEAIALMEAMKEVKSRGFANVIFETNSKNVVDATHCLHTGVSEFSSLICEIKNILSLSTNFEVKFIKR